MPTEEITAEDKRAGRIMLQVADGLADYGLEILDPKGVHQFRVSNVPGALCELVVRKSGRVHWEYRPIWATRSAPAQITAMVLTLLGAEAGTRQSRIHAV